MITLDAHTRRCDLCGSQFERDEQLQDRRVRTHEAETSETLSALPDLTSSLP